MKVEAASGLPTPPIMSALWQGWLSALSVKVGKIDPEKVNNWHEG